MIYRSFRTNSTKQALLVLLKWYLAYLQKKNSWCNSVDKDLLILNPLYHQEILRFHALIGEYDNRVLIF